MEKENMGFIIIRLKTKINEFSIHSSFWVFFFSCFWKASHLAFLKVLSTNKLEVKYVTNRQNNIFHCRINSYSNKQMFGSNEQSVIYLQNEPIDCFR